MLVTHGAPRAGHAPVALTIGNFDGVHKGHQALLARVLREARVRKLSSCVLSFEPHPREFFQPAAAPARLTSLREKLELFDAHGVERVHVQRFDREFSRLTAETFVREVLEHGLRARWILVGDDFRFGAERAGDFALLREFARSGEFEVEAMSTFIVDGVRVSSGVVREALAKGDLARAQALLGRPYSMSGRVVHGDKLGRKIGFSTANIQMKHNRPPLTGIFAVRLLGGGREPLPGAASLGVRPTVKKDGVAVLEVHLFDFTGDLYGRHVRVEFLHKIRDEEKYADLDALRAQIARDCDAAKSFLTENRNG